MVELATILVPSATLTIHKRQNFQKRWKRNMCWMDKKNLIPGRSQIWSGMLSYYYDRYVSFAVPRDRIVRRSASIQGVPWFRSLKGCEITNYFIARDDIERWSCAYATFDPEVRVFRNKFEIARWRDNKGTDLEHNRREWYLSYVSGMFILWKTRDT